MPRGAVCDATKLNPARSRFVTLENPPLGGVSRRTVFTGLLALSPALAHAQMAPPPPVILKGAQRAAAIEAVNAAETHGLARRTLSDKASDEEVTDALLRYAREVHVGRLALGDFPNEWGVRPTPYDPRPTLEAALASGKFEAWLAGLPPPYPGYRGLRRGLAAYRKIAADGGWPTVPEGPAMSLGAKGPRVAALRARLKAEGGKVGDSDVFDKSVQDAIIKAQKEFGLKPDGVVAAETLAALNQPIGQRVLQIIANMERWRWLPPTLPPTRVQVNSGAAIVTLFRDDRPVLSMKAVAGRRGDETPMLMSDIHSVVLNPPWNVPASIASKELWPKEKANPGYLARNGYTVISTEGGSRLQQKPGPKSSLGLFKFDFDNPYGVYLHDTPAQAGFTRYARQASHGCVRLEKPHALATALLSGDAVWTEQKVSEALAKGDTVRARLPAATPVFIFYWTAFAGAEGAMNFRSDPYDWDRMLLQKIGVLGEKA